jgi:outer membrane protein TolC
VARAKLALQRARAEVVPNVQVGGGYFRSFSEQEAGALISVQTSVPVWDCKQGLIYQAEARWTQAEAARRSIVLHLGRETAAAFGRYRSALQEVQRLEHEVLPRAREGQRGVRGLFQAGSAQVSFADVLQTQDTLNDLRRRLVTARRELWLAIADLQGLMQLDLDEEVPDCR